MLISPPFLPPVNGQSDNSWLDMAMTTPENEGAFPVTDGLAWHGGMHLLSPSNIPVCAIADGTVVYVRKATERNTNADDPLNYHAGSTVSGWTSDGCVIIQHDTEIGTGVNSSVRFFSITMHLENIPAVIVKGKPVFRKDSIGQAGYTNGKPGRIHFEIICDDENVKKLVGRDSGSVPNSSNGRVDAIYGDIYFHLPVGTQFFNEKPVPLPNPVSTPHPHPHPHPHPQPQPQPVVPALIYTTGEEFYIGIRYAGSAHITTYTPSGSIIGSVLHEPDAEYDLYETSTNLHSQCTSAAYELLRFGRVLGEDILSPATTAHWRKVHYPGGQGWVDLAPAVIRKFSDADFPHWRGWTLVDDSADVDSRMDSVEIRDWLDIDKNGKVTEIEARTRLADTVIQDKLKYVICKIPTEWSASTIEKRWGWLKESSAEHEQKLEADDFNELQRHISKLCFWDDAGLSINESHWHFQPKEFIRHFRKCMWYSTNELARCIPRRSLTGTVTWAAAIQRAAEHKESLNLLFRKYIGENRIRHIHSLAQIYIETGVLRLLDEGGAGAGKNYTAFYGRGYMQLTWASNYDVYGKFKNLSEQSHPAYSDARITTTSTHVWSDGAAARRWAPRYDPSIISRNLSHGAESSGLYWISKHFRGQKNINKVSDLGLTPTIVGFISWLVNGGGNGYSNRQQFAGYLKNVLLDDPLILGAVPLQYPSLTPPGNPSLCAHFPPVEIPYNQLVTIYYDRQIP